MIRNLGEVLAEFERFHAQVVPEELTDLVRATHMEALSRIVLRTPVDTGRARNSWQSTVGRPATTDLRLDDPIAEGERVLEGLAPFTPTYISSNVPYILRLEYGHSRQAPEGMVALTVEELRTALPEELQ